MSHRALAAICAWLFVSAMPLRARAQSADFTRSEAAERFDRAIRLVDAGDLSGGLAEFQRAYALVPSPIVSYNLGLVYAELQRPVASVTALEKALASAAALKPEDAERARRVLQVQKDKTGHVSLAVSVKQGVVEIDNIEVAKLPLSGPLDVAGGAHVVGVVSPGYAPARKEVVVAGNETTQVELELIAIEGLLAHIGVQCRIPAADVFVDGARVGKTPLEATVTVAPGAHQVEVRRAGYVSVLRSIALQDGARGDLSMNPTIDARSLDREGGYLEIRVNETQAVVGVDGDEAVLVAGPIALPAGPHRLRVERGGFLPVERDLEIPLSRTATVSVAFEPTPDTRARYVASAESRRTWSWVTIGAGAAVAIGGVALAAAENAKLPDAQHELDAVNADWVPASRRVCDPKQPQQATCASRLDDATARVNDIETRRSVGWVAAGIGGAVTVTGIVLLLTGDNPHKYDERPSEHLFAGLRIVPMLNTTVAAVSASGSF